MTLNERRELVQEYRVASDSRREEILLLLGEDSTLHVSREEIDENDLDPSRETE
jgi:hypothetical protein